MNLTETYPFAPGVHYDRQIYSSLAINLIINLHRFLITFVPYRAYVGRAKQFARFLFPGFRILFGSRFQAPRDK